MTYKIEYNDNISKTNRAENTVSAVGESVRYRLLSAWPAINARKVFLITGETDKWTLRKTLETR